MQNAECGVVTVNGYDTCYSAPLLTEDDSHHTAGQYRLSTPEGYDLCRGKLDIITKQDCRCWLKSIRTFWCGRVQT
ncbi:uncharacterized protein SETTUDRAFT_167840 [Exserohilum turcica Et28A]|uniref:Uncharacterized protein n=1 Tax=Exserohilum turcicum (strain 28A) TaxID=671987 RepID=R0K8M6_EXST2|nr:uncharacterized protein SETTUDRAFT_167840 [Exserohilum turcica Et28A]EOA89318.1 hypothetical protein SETTUDRAFT_167840 [Exserohilum turcica Et28A]